MSSTTFLVEPEPLDREQSVELYLKSRLQSLDRAVAGYTSVSLQGLSGTVDLSPTQAKHRSIKLTGAPSGAVTLRIPATTGANCDIHFSNACTGSFSSVTGKSMGANAGNSAGVVLTTGRRRMVLHDGESAYPAGLEVDSATGIAYPPDVAFTAVTFQNSWVDFGGTFRPTGYSLFLGEVRLRGCVKSGTVGSAIFTLPTNCRPSKIERFSCPNQNPGDVCNPVDVGTDGTIKLVSGGNTFLSLSGIRFVPN